MNKEINRGIEIHSVFDNISRRLYKNMIVGGFSEDEISTLSGLIDVRSATRNPDEPYFASFKSALTESLFAFLSSAVPDQKNRPLILYACINSWDEIKVFPNRFVDVISEVSKMASVDKVLDREFRIFCSQINIHNQETFSEFMDLGTRIMRDGRIFRMFAGSGARVAEFVDTSIFSLALPVDQLNRFLTDLFVGKYTDVFIEGLDASMFSRVDEYPWSVDMILRDKKKSALANKLLRFRHPWEVKLQNFPDIIKSLGFPVVNRHAVENKLFEDYAEEVGRIRKINSGNLRKVLESLPPEEKFKYIRMILKRKGERTVGYKERIATLGYEVAPAEVLARIKRRENPKHPLNSLGLAKTVGYEIEFPRTELVKSMSESGLFQILALAGLKEGLGGDKADETSPGPFWDPETANTVFRIYCDAGIIEPELYENGLTYHFNFGLSSGSQLCYLVRGLYLTGAAHNFRSRWSSLPHIHTNCNKSLRYFECKSFKVMTAHGFEWNMKHGAYLTWALGASQKEESVKPLTPLERELAGIWHKYISILQSGLNYVGLSGYFEEEFFVSKISDAVDGQLKLIFPTPSSRYRDLSRVSGGKISRVVVGDRVWPNIAVFAKDVAEVAVDKVEALADRVEKDAITEIKRMDAEDSGRKRLLIDMFVKKYNVKVGERRSLEDKQKAYQEVREIFCDII